MRRLSASELLETWDNASGQAPIRRALVLLQAASPDTTPEQLAELTIGQRDARLLVLRELTFGPHLSSIASCPACGEKLELNFSTSDLDPASDTGPPRSLTLSLDGYEMSIRLPTSTDLIAVSREQPDANLAQAALLARCVSGATFNGAEIAAAGLPDGMVDVIAARMAEADPQADMQLDLSCPVCGNRWRSRFDIESFFWAEINAWAMRVLGEVHALASAYGWSETDILRMSARRRRCYLNLVA